MNELNAGFCRDQLSHPDPEQGILPSLGLRHSRLENEDIFQFSHSIPECPCSWYKEYK